MSDTTSSARVPGSLRAFRTIASSAPLPTAIAKPDVRAATVLTAACLVAAPLQGAFAQQAPGSGVTPLPPVTVDAQPGQKKRAPQAAPQPAPAAQAAPLPEQKSANPYANANAPYKVETSGSTKITEPLANTAKTVTTIPKEVIRDTAATSIRDLARQTPGVTLGFGEGGNAFGDRIFIRGFDARNDIYVDGMRDAGNTSRETFAVEQAEVYKGPGGVIGGRGTPGGALNIITKRPNETQSFYQLSTMIGTDGTRRVTTDVNQVMAPGFSIRGNVLYHESDVAGRDFVEDKRWGGFFAATLKPSDTFKVTLDYYRLRTDGTPDFGIPANPVTKQPWTESGLARTTWYGNAMRDFIRNESDIFGATVEWKVAPGVTLTSRSRIGQNITDYVASAPGQSTANYALGLVSLGNPNRYQDTDFAINQTDVTSKFSTGSWQHTLVTGVELSRENTSRFGYTLVSNGTQPLFTPDPYRGLLNASFNNIGPRTLTFDATVDTKSAYILDTIKLSEQWIVNGGARIDNYNKTQIGNTASTTASREDTVFNWHAGIVYKPIPISSFYAAIATASSPAGAELDASSPTYGGLTVDSSRLSPERSTGIEVGTKWELFSRRLLATAALFQTDKEDAREVIGTTVSSTAAYRVRGVELSAQGNITDKWSVFGGIVFLDTEVTKSAVASNVGLEMANVPTRQFSLLSKYKLTDQLTIGGQAIYNSELKGGTTVANTGYTTVPWWRFDALSEYKVDKHLTVQLNVVNLTNEVYYDAVYQSANPFVYVAPGRAGYLTLSWKY